MIPALSRRRRDSDVAIGHRYRKRDAPRIIWEVETVFDGVDGMTYAAMFRVDDPSMRKTVARASLERGNQYQRIQHRE